MNFMGGLGVGGDVDGKRRFSGDFVPLVVCKGVEKLWKSGRYYWWI